jgi:uncharacterized protein YcbK (DUF882 family)
VTQTHAPLLTRRQLLAGLAASGAALIAHPALASFPPAKPRVLSFENLHTGEKLRKVAYYEGGRYLPDAMKEINRLLRDHRTGDVHAIDPELMDVLFRVQHKVESRSSFQIISGYRSPHSNAMLNKRSNGVAKKSLHMEGKAVDIRLGDRSLDEVHQAGLMLGLGGVGYYPASDFVHFDTGRVRSW